MSSPRVSYAYPDGSISLDGVPRVLATNWLALDRAALCLDADCETIYPLSAHECPKCGGMQRSELATWLRSAKGEK